MNNALAQMRDITVTLPDGSTTITYTVLTGAPGDGFFAQWRQVTDGPSSTAGTLRCKVNWNGPKTGRRVEINGTFPIVIDDAITQRKKVFSSAPFSFTVLTPSNLTSKEALDMAYVVTGLVSNELFKEVIASGISPV